MNYVIGDTALIKDILQSRHGDFVWTLPFVDVAADGTETETDLTGCEFAFVVFGLDGTTEIAALEIGTGIDVSDNVVTVSIDNADLVADYVKGCKYPYYLTYTNAAGHTKCLFEGKFITT